MIIGVLLSCSWMLAALSGSGSADELAAPFAVEARGAVIDVEGGHAAPFFHDLDGDGLAELFVGQFAGGKLRIYRNVGARGAPRFEDFRLFEAAGAHASVPFG